MKLLPTQKNTLFNLIESFGLSPSAFAWSNETNTNGAFATVLKYRDSDFSFRFETYTSSIGSGYQVNHYSPANSSYEETVYPKTWTEQVIHFQGWLSFLKREISQPDKWAQLQDEIEQINFVDIENDGEKFSVHEYEELKTKINLLKEKVAALELLPEQIAGIHNKLDYLVEKAKETSKFDWKNLFIGMMASSFVQLAVTPANIKSLWNIIKNTFTTFLLP